MLTALHPWNPDHVLYQIGYREPVAGVWSTAHTPHELRKLLLPLSHPSPCFRVAEAVRCLFGCGYRQRATALLSTVLQETYPRLRIDPQGREARADYLIRHLLTLYGEKKPSQASVTGFENALFTKDFLAFCDPSYRTHLKTLHQAAYACYLSRWSHLPLGGALLQEDAKGSLTWFRQKEKAQWQTYLTYSSKEKEPPSTTTYKLLADPLRGFGLLPSSPEEHSPSPQQFLYHSLEEVAAACFLI